MRSSLERSGAAAQAIAFLGPTLAYNQAASVLGAQYRGPAAHGDVHDAVIAGATSILLIDGYFGSVQSVWHKEILFALEQGVGVYGAASMGALRAAELAPFGMVGVGAIYRAYEAGDLTGDDEVAVLHAPADMGYAGLTVALADVRAMACRAVPAGVLTQAECEDVIAAARAIHFSQRSVEALAGLRLEHWTAARAAEYARWFTGNFISQKALDALELLERFATGTAGARADRQIAQHLPRTIYWQRRFPAAIAGEKLAFADYAVLSELRLRPDAYLSSRSAPEAIVFNRTLAVRAAQKQRWLRDRHGLNGLAGGLAETPGRILRRWLWLHRTELFAHGIDFRAADEVAQALGFESLDEFAVAVAVETQFSTESPEDATQEAAMPEETQTWHVWMYMSSQNDPLAPLIDFEAQALQSVNQIRSAMPFSKTRYVILYDGRDTPDGPAETYRLDMSQTEELVQKGPSKNFGTPETLINFIFETKAERRDAKKVLVLWGHGLAMEFLPDSRGQTEGSKRSILDIATFIQAMTESFKHRNIIDGHNRFDIVCLDCCFMAQIETMARFAAIADYVVAAPAAVPLISWPYGSVAEIFESRFQSTKIESVAASLATAGRDYFLENDEFDSPLLAIKTDMLMPAVHAQHQLGACLASLITGTEKDWWKQRIKLARLGARGHHQAADYAELESFCEGLLKILPAALNDAKLSAGEAEKIDSVIAQAIVDGRNALVYPAPVRGAASPRSAIVWFPLQAALFTASAKIYAGLLQGLDIWDGGNAGWARFLSAYHELQFDLAPLAQTPKAEHLLMAVPGAARTSSAVDALQKLQVLNR